MDTKEIARAVGPAMVTSALTLALFAAARRKKALGYELVSSEPLSTPGPGMKEIAERVRVTIDGNPVIDPHLAIVRVCNAGPTAVLPEDFVRTLRIDVGAAIVALEVLARASHHTGDIGREGSAILMPPSLFNVDDDVRLKIYTSGAPQKTPSHDGAIRDGAVTSLLAGPPAVVKLLAYLVGIFTLAFAAWGMSLMLWGVVSALRNGGSHALLAFAEIAGLVLGPRAAMLVSAIALDRRNWPTSWRRAS